MSSARAKTGSPAAKESFQQAFERIGGVEALATWAQGQPTEFFRLFTRLILAGDEAASEGVKVEIVRFSDHADDPSA
jgi:hypothetical protein